MPHCVQQGEGVHPQMDNNNLIEMAKPVEAAVVLYYR